MSGEVNSRGTNVKRSCLRNGDKILGGRYEVLKCIHSRGMANVYIVQDLNLCKQWCLKEIRKSQGGKKDIEYISLLQEANILRSLNNERIPRITTIDEEGDSLFVIMDFLDGVTLKDFVENKGKVPEDVAVNWMLQIVQTMAYLHSEKHNKKPIFFRDMKPDNIMIRPNGAVNLFDFGISIRVESEDQLPDYTLGTPGYVAPEQKRKDLPVDLRSDIYAMGRTFYFMLTGVDPRGFTTSSLKPISDWSPEISSALVKIVDKCMSNEADSRYQDCEELQYDLENYRYFDEKYKSTAKRKIAVTITSALLGGVLMLGSMIPFRLSVEQSANEYLRLVAVAEQSGRLDDYYTAISFDPLNISPYMGFIDAIKEDGIFSKEEEKMLLENINPNLIELRENSDFGRIAYEIGRLYWFYYDDDSGSGKTLSIKWFEDAISAGCNVEESTIYFNLGVFKRDISKSIKDASDEGMYRSYWDNLLSSQKSSTNDLVTMETYISVAECISTYSYNLKKDGVTYEEIMEEVGILKSFVSNYTPDESSLETIHQLYNELVNILDGLDNRIAIVYQVSSGGDD